MLSCISLCVPLSAHVPCEPRHQEMKRALEEQIAEKERQKREAQARRRMSDAAGQAAAPGQVSPGMPQPLQDGYNGYLEYNQLGMPQMPMQMGMQPNMQPGMPPDMQPGMHPGMPSMPYMQPIPGLGPGMPMGAGGQMISYQPSLAPGSHPGHPCPGFGVPPAGPGTPSRSAGAVDLPVLPQRTPEPPSHSAL